MLSAATRRAAFSTVIPRRFSSTAIPVRDIETRWAKLPEAEKGAVAEMIYNKENGDWRNMSMDEKRASYFIAYGPHGARSPRSQDHNVRVAAWVAGIVGVSIVCWQWWLSAMKPKLITDAPEWAEARKQKDIEHKINPFQGEFYEERIKNEKN